MSEYQFVQFLALDTPLTDRQMEFMRQQSTRARITRWEFTNEYQWGDFHGNARGMLRQGFDVHLHYANFGIRRLMFRLPTGLPADRSVVKAFCEADGIGWDADKKGPGGILEFNPNADASDFNEVLYGLDEFLRSIAPVRDLLMAGDLRALYLAWLVGLGEPDGLEPPVPAGMAVLSPPLRALADFYEIGPDLLAAVAERSPPLPETPQADERLERWIARQSKADLQQYLRMFLSEDVARARGAIWTQVRKATPATAWPMAKPLRTLEALQALAVGYREKRLQKEEKTRETARRKRIKAMANDPDKVIAQVESLVAQRSEVSYSDAADMLLELREALGPTAGPPRVRAVAKRLCQKNPTRRLLTAALRRKGLLD